MYRKAALVIVIALALGISSVQAIETYQGEVYDFSGATVVIQGSSNAPSMAGLGMAPHDAYWQWEDDPVARAHKAAVEELFNVNLVFEPRPRDGSRTWIADIMAGDPYADIMGRSTSDYKHVELAGACLPLDDYIDDDFLELANPYWVQHRDTVFGHSGSTYSLYVGSRGYLPYALVWWNRDLFERSGYSRDHIWDLVDAGEWTWEAFIDLAEDLTQDFTGNGEIDQFGNMRGPRNDWIFSNVTDFVIEQDGRLVPAFDQPEWLDILEVFADMRDREIPQANDFRPSGTHRRQMFVDGQVAMEINNNHAITWYPAMLDMADDYALAPLPMGPTHGQHLSYYNGANHHFFPVTTDNPEAMLALQQAVYRMHRDWDEDVERVMEYRSAQFRDMRSIEVLREGLMNPDYAVQAWQRMPHPIGSVTGGMDPRAAIDSVMPEAQAWLDEVFGQ